MDSLQIALVGAGIAEPQIDPRADSEEKIVPPEPLPHVSRRALRRVKNPLPFPKSCPHCGGSPRIVDHSEIYGGRRFGEWPYAIACDSCDAYVGLHPHTDIPLGTLADKELREARKSGKAEFFDLQECTGWDRKKAYRWLADQLGISVGECHWGWFDKKQCESAKRACERELERHD